MNPQPSHQSFDVLSLFNPFPSFGILLGYDWSMSFVRPIITEGAIICQAYFLNFFDILGVKIPTSSNSESTFFFIL
ncbi:hypothetical protein 268TH004_62 [Bacillus phage 268TH004]|uniref:Uncharacterized protein n=1 Tax=Bacillus phage 268TH004 TaxID=2801523 RepID=A0A7T7ZAN5_9CAUD|nr:hypothetical protein 268TH004_62 [Bacillus phage 268TH004]